MLCLMKYSPVPVEEQIAIIFASTKGFTDSIDVDRMKDFEASYIKEMKLR